MLNNKKGLMVSPGDFFKGLIVGIIVGGAIVYLGTTGVIQIPFL